MNHHVEGAFHKRLCVLDCALIQFYQCIYKKKYSYNSRSDYDSDQGHGLTEVCKAIEMKM